MTEYRHGAHRRVFSIHLHIVWITKYRKPVLIGDIALKVREVTREICRSEFVEIIRGHISRDHILLFVSIPPQMAISRLVRKVNTPPALAGGVFTFSIVHA